MKIAYFDCFSGASGDMLLGCLLDAGLRLEDLEADLAWREVRTAPPAPFPPLKPS